MMSRFYVTNYKCLQNVDIPLTPIHVIIGQNDAGKSSLLEAMYALYRSSMFPVKDAFPEVWVSRELVFERSERPTVSLGAGWEAPDLDKCAYSIDVEFPFPDHNCVVSSESFTVANSDPVVISEEHQSETRVAHLRRNPAAVDPMREKLSKVTKCLNNAHLYRFDPKTMALPSALELNRRFVMDVDGFGLASMLDDILGYDVELFKKIRNSFCDLFPQFSNVRIQTSPAVERRAFSQELQKTDITMGKGIYFETRAGTNIRSFQASAGAILILGFIALSNLPDPPKLLLIEEPENGIYPKRLQQVIEMLRAITAKQGGAAPQLVLTTHSPYMLSFFAPEEVTFMCRRPDGRVTARPMREAPHIHERMGREFNLGELWYNLSEEDLFGNA